MEEGTWINFAWATGAQLAPASLTVTYVVARSLSEYLLPRPIRERSIC